MGSDDPFEMVKSFTDSFKPPTGGMGNFMNSTWGGSYQNDKNAGKSSNPMSSYAAFSKHIINQNKDALMGATGSVGQFNATTSSGGFGNFGMQGKRQIKEGGPSTFSTNQSPLAKAKENKRTPS